MWQGMKKGSTRDPMRVAGMQPGTGGGGDAAGMWHGHGIGVTGWWVTNMDKDMARTCKEKLRASMLRQRALMACRALWWTGFDSAAYSMLCSVLLIFRASAIWMMPDIFLPLIVRLL